jgi:hypothetical protein
MNQGNPHSAVTGLQIREVLLDSFPRLLDWEQLVAFAFDVRLARISVEPSLTAIAYRVCQWAESQGRLGALLAEARTLNPDNPALESLVTAYDSAPSGTVYFGPDLSWESVRRACFDLSQRAFEKMRDLDRALSYTSRPAIQSHIDQFLQSHATFLVITGESGIGKTYLLQHVAKQMARTPDVAVLAYDAYGLQYDTSLMEQIEQDLRRPLQVVEPVRLHTLEKDVITPARRLLVFIDALNESDEPLRLMQQIDSLSVCGLRCVKVILTCRPHVWQQIQWQRSGITRSRYYQPPGSSDPFIELQKFTALEAAKAYQSYQEVWHFAGPPFSALPQHLQNRFADPLLLRLVAEIYAGKELPGDVAALDVDLVRDYMQHLVNEGRLHQDCESFLKHVLNPKFLENDCCTAVISRSQLVDSAHPHAAKQYLEYLEELLKTGVLMETTAGRGLNARGTIRYRYERFQDYYLGLMLYERLHVGNGA